MVETVTRTLRLKVKRNSYAWLNAAAVEVNQVWNWANETSAKAARPYFGKPKWLSNYDLDKLSAGATKCFEHIGSSTINRVNDMFVRSRRKAKKCKLRWRKSSGSKRSLGWVPYRVENMRRKGAGVCFYGKGIRLFEASRLDGVKIRDGCFAQDALGDWWLCAPVDIALDQAQALQPLVGIDLGLKDAATTSDGVKLAAGQFYRGIEEKLRQAQRRAHKRKAKRLHRKAASRRKDALHKFSRQIVNTYQNIIVGDVSSTKLIKTRMAKSVLDAGWGQLKTFLQYKGQQAGRTVEIVNEAHTSRTCSSCGARTGPSGVNGLRVRAWDCRECGASHDRDVNAARNIAMLGSRMLTSVCGNVP